MLRHIHAGIGADSYKTAKRFRIVRSTRPLCRYLRILVLTDTLAPSDSPCSRVNFRPNDRRLRLRSLKISTVSKFSPKVQVLS